MAFQRDFNELLNEILTNYRNQFPGDVTPGSVLFVKASCTASMLWGLYRQIDKVADQIFVSTADRAHIELHAAEFGIATAGKTDAWIVDEVLAAKRSKLAGGNRYDYAAWAREVSVGGVAVTSATVVELAQGEGTFDIVIDTSAPLENITYPQPEIVAKVMELCQARRPIGSGFSWGMRVLLATRQAVALVMEGTGAAWDTEATRSAVTAYVNGLEPGQRMVLSMILAIAHEYGADTVKVTSHDTDLTPEWDTAGGYYGVLRLLGIVITRNAP